MAFINKFSKITRGGLFFTGNTLGLSKSEDSLSAGKIGSIGAFTSLKEAEQVPTFPAKTTLDYSQNGSTSNLSIPEGSEILHAELIWSGLYKSKNSDISSSLSNKIKFITPLGEYSIDAEHLTKQEKIVKVNGINLGIYVRSASVTQLVKKALSGEYSVSGVPALCEKLDNDTGKTNFAGWTLAVAFANKNYSVNKLSINVGLEVVYSDNTNVDISLPGIEIPIGGVKKARMYLSSGEGDAHLSGDSVYYGKNSSNLLKLSGPNNPENNFFASQINGFDGKLDVSGQFGDRNSDAKNLTNIDGGRQGWDITSVDITNAITTSQVNPIARFTSSGDMYFPNAIGLEIESLNGDVVVTKTVNKTSVVLDEEFSYTIEIKNTGDLKATNLTLNEGFPNGSVLVPNTFVLDGNIINNPIFPLKLKDLQGLEKHLITFTMKMVGIPKELPIKNIAKLYYRYLIPSGETVSSVALSNETQVNLIVEKIEVTKSVDKNYAIKGEKLTYTNMVSKKVSSGFKHVKFIDKLPEGTSFVEGSVKIDGESFPSYNPEIGFSLGDFSTCKTKVVTFDVLVICP